VPRTPQQTLELYQMSRAIQWRYRLDQVEAQALERSLRTIERAIPQALYDAKGLRGAYSRGRSLEVQRELRGLFTGVREQLTGEISTMAGQAGAESARFHSQTLSVQGLTQVNNVALSAQQFKSFFEKTPLGGHALKNWVGRAFDHAVASKVKMDLDAGVLLGKSYKGLVNNIMGHMDGFTRREAVNLAKSYVQSGNVAAHQAVMQANEDIVKGWRWSAVLEPFDMETGRGTCLVCSGLDGQEYELGQGPSIPNHVACRCVPITVTKTWRELGLDRDELEQVARPWTDRGDLPIGEGGRNILDYGKHKGNYASWFDGRGDQFKQNVLGPKRYELYKQGKIGFGDLVDKQTGRLLRVDELPGGAAVMGRRGLAPPSPMIVRKFEGDRFFQAKEFQELKKMSDRELSSHPLWGKSGKIEHGQDMFLKELNKRQGYDGLPNVMPVNEFQKVPGETLHRGLAGTSRVPAEKMIEQYKSGDLFTGLGIYGNGTYTAYGQYGELVARGYTGEKGKVLQMKLKPEAKVITRDDLKKVRSQILKDVFGIEKVGMDDPFIQKAYQYIFADDCHFATMLGYDAINVTSRNYMIILNRTATIVPK